MNDKAKQFRRLLADWEDAPSRVRIEQEEYLRKEGWVHTSDTPYNFWLWTKTVTYNGQTFTALVDTATALRFVQYELIGYDEDDDEDDEEVPY